MLGKLRLREQGLLLIAVPLLFELLFVFILTVMLLDLEKAATKESQAKTILSLTTELDQSSMASITTLPALGLSGFEGFSERMQESIDKVNSLCLQLRAALKNDPESLTAFADIEKGYHDVFARITDLKNGYDRRSHSMVFVQFTSDRDYFEQLNFDMKQLARQTAVISNKYNKTISELSPQAESFRTAIECTIIVGILGNILLCVYLGIYFSRVLVGRVQVIMDNTARFRDGRDFLAPVSGVDEISQLDTAFREMAASRLRSEQLRKDLVAMVSHDLRGPLTSIHGYLVMLTTRQLAPEAAKMIERAESEMRRLIRLAHDLLDNEKIESGSLTLVISCHDVSDLLDEAVGAVKAMAEIKKIKIEKNAPLELTCNCDGDRIIQVLVNLLLNAIRFSPVAAKIDIEARQFADSVEFAVVDQGPGVPADQTARLFDRFTQLEQTEEQRQQGSGLGLAICKSLVELHAGTIGVESKVGSGSRFWLRIPNQPNKTE